MNLKIELLLRKSKILHKLNFKIYQNVTVGAFQVGNIISLVGGQSLI